jgi:hypothetical protein
MGSRRVACGQGDEQNGYGTIDSTTLADWESLRPFFALDPPAQRACLKRQKAQRRILIKVLLEVQPELLHVIIIIPGPTSTDDNMKFRTESSWCHGDPSKLRTRKPTRIYRQLTIIQSAPLPQIAAR